VYVTEDSYRVRSTTVARRGPTNRKREDRRLIWGNTFGSFKKLTASYTTRRWFRKRRRIEIENVGHLWTAAFVVGGGRHI
jgi:hypothetical protein